jgi:hypothetical protein
VEAEGEVAAPAQLPLVQEVTEVIPAAVEEAAAQATVSTQALAVTVAMATSVS